MSAPRKKKLATIPDEKLINQFSLFKNVVVVFATLLRSVTNVKIKSIQTNRHYPLSYQVIIKRIKSIKQNEERIIALG